MRLCRRRRIPSRAIGAVERAGEVIEEQREPAASEPEQLFEPRAYLNEVGLVGVPNVQSRAEPIDEVEAEPVARLDQLLELSGFRPGVKLAPERALLQVILGCVEVRVQPPGGHPVEERGALDVGPRLSVEPFNHAGQEAVGW